MKTLIITSFETGLGNPMRKSILVALLMVLCAAPSFAQWSGPTTAVIGSSQNYSYTGGIFTTATFQVTGGSVVPGSVTLSANRTTAYCQINWTSWGLQTLTVKNNGNVVSSVQVNVVCPSGITAPSATVKRLSDNAMATTGCINTSFLITGTMGSGGISLRWYDSPTATVPFHTGNTYTTPALTAASTTYYIATYYGGSSGGGGGVEEAASDLRMPVTEFADLKDIFRTIPLPKELGRSSVVVADCMSERTAVTITTHAYPDPVISNSTTAICSGDYTYISSTNAAGVSADYSWAASLSAASGNTLGGGSVIQQSLSSTANYNGTVTYTVYVVAGGCTRTGTTSVAVKPRPDATTSSQAAICSGQGTSFSISTPKGVSGTSFSWTTSGANVSGAYNGSGTYVGQTLSNSTNTDQYMTYSITPTANGCAGSVHNQVVTVKPLPSASITNNLPSFCAGLGTNISLSSPVSGTSFSYTVNPNITNAFNGSGNSISQELWMDASVGSPQTVTYTVTPVANGCTGPTNSTSVTVKPYPSIAATNQILCSGQQTSIAITNPNNVSGTTFTWTASQSGASGASNGSGSLIAQTLSATGSSAGTASYVITATANGCTVTKSASPVVATVKPIPTVSVVNNLTSICSGAVSSITISNPNNLAGTTLSWTATPINVNGSSGGSGSSISQTLATTTSSNGSVDYVATASLNGCSSSTSTAVTVKALPTGAPTVTGNTKWGEGAMTLTASGGAEYLWYNPSNAVVDGDGNAFYPITATSSQTNHGYVKYRAQGCIGSSATWYNVLVEPLPTALTSHSVVAMNTPFTLSTASNYNTYVWKKGNTVIPNQSPAYQQVLNTPGAYSVTVSKTGIEGTATANFVVAGQFDALNENYVASHTPLRPTRDANAIHLLPVDSVSQSIQYFDGLGRAFQSIATQASPLKQDIITPSVYDAFGREHRKYLPFTPAQRTGRPVNSIIDPVSGNYMGIVNTYTGADPKIASDPRPFSEIEFEPSMLNRPAKEFGPGVNWKNNNAAVQHDYLTNVHGTSTGQEKIIAWKISAAGLPERELPVANYIVTGGYYASGQLMIKSTKDEQGNEVREYTDKSGKVILKKVQAVVSPTLSNRDHWTQTYYIYDDLGNLRFVLQPELSRSIHVNDTYIPNTTELGALAFQYKYDSRNRVTEKIVPGAAVVFMAYDNRDRLVVMQDGNMRSNYRWLFTKYDHLNRPIATGILQTLTNEGLITQAIMQQRINDYYANLATNGGSLYETFVGNVAGNMHGYTNKSYPIITSFPNNVADPFSYLTVTYYDNYEFKNLVPGNYQYTNESLSQTVGGITYSQPAQESIKTTGLVTGTRTKVLDGGWTGGYTFLNGVNYYDEKGRLVQSISDNYKGGYDRATNLYDFIGKPLRNKATHSEADLNWKELVNVRLEGNKLLRVGSTNAWSSGAVSVEQLPPGIDGWVETPAGYLNGGRIIGFSSQNIDTDISTIAFGLNFGGGAGGPTFRVYEMGSIKFVGTGFLSTDVFRVERVGTTIRYLRNGIVFYTSTTPSSTTLMVDVGLYGTTDVLFHIKASFATKSKTITRRFEYDHGGRVTSVFHQLDTNPEILLTRNEYNSLGQLVDKKLHSTQSSASDAKQSVDFRYNIRGWLTSINNAGVTSDGATNDDANDLFGMNLSYDEIVSGLTTTTDRQFNGNISATQWSNNLALGTMKSRGYKFAYDPLNRLMSATHTEKAGSWNSSNAFHENNLSYDHNGNILTLNRTGAAGEAMDVLQYTYNAGGYKRNHLAWITDSGDKNKGFKEPTTTGNNWEYSYDANGNMMFDYNRPGSEILKNPSFDNGSADWTLGGETSQLSFGFGQLNVGAGTGATASITQLAVVTGARPYLMSIDVVKTSSTGSVTVSLGGGTPTTISTTSVISIPMYAGGSDGTFTVSATGGFTGTIKSVSLKACNFVSYNYLNLPYTVSRSLDDMLRYTYDASGRKLMQEVVDKNLVLKKRSEYDGEFFYENDTLKFINHDEGRVVMTSTSPEYQYHLKDHLGNVRLTFTTKNETESGIATYEPANAATEQSKFLRMEHARKVLSSLMDRTNGAADGHAQRLTGGTNEKYGIAKSISVMPGDTIKAEVYAKYVDTNSSNWTAALASLMSQVSNANPAVVLDGAAYNTSTTSFGFAGMNGTDASTGDGPKAYLNWLIFDRSYTFKDGGYVRLSAAPKEAGQNVAHERLASQIVAKEPGYVYVYLSNEEGTPLEVYFDDFKVDHAKSPVVQMDDYYPFGLTFNSYQRENSVDQKFRFQGQEHIDDLDLGWVSFKWRNHMPEIGRFFNVDPLAESFYYNSTYAFSENKVTNHIELEGLEAYPAQQALNREIKKVENAVTTVVNKTTDGVKSVVSVIGDGIKSAWNSLSPGSDRGGSTWTTKEHSGGDQRDVPDGQADGGGNVDALIAPTLRSSPAGKVVESVSQGVEMATFVESKTHVIENVMKETGGNTTTLEVNKVKDTTETKNFTFYQVETTNGTDSVIQVSKTPDTPVKKDDQKK